MEETLEGGRGPIRAVVSLGREREKREKRERERERTSQKSADLIYNVAET
jgi:hypothetical protein